MHLKNKWLLKISQFTPKCSEILWDFLSRSEIWYVCEYILIESLLYDITCFCHFYLMCWQLSQKYLENIKLRRKLCVTIKKKSIDELFIINCDSFLNLGISDSKHCQESKCYEVSCSMDLWIYITWFWKCKYRLTKWKQSSLVLYCWYWQYMKHEINYLKWNGVTGFLIILSRVCCC